MTAMPAARPSTATREFLSKGFRSFVPAGMGQGGTTMVDPAATQQQPTLAQPHA